LASAEGLAAFDEPNRRCPSRGRNPKCEKLASAKAKIVLAANLNIQPIRVAVWLDGPKFPDQNLIRDSVAYMLLARMAVPPRSLQMVRYASRRGWPRSKSRGRAITAELFR